MRNPKRIPIIIKELEKVWKANPDLRLAQLLWNVFRDDPYNIDDSEFIQIIKEFYDPNV